MIISRTPFRISFFGGGTDYTEWLDHDDGCVLSTTFDKYSYITCRVLPPFFDHRYRIAYSRVENVGTVEEIIHPAVRAVLSEHASPHGLEIHCDADLPARSGLGSSSTFVVGLLHAVQALKGVRVSKAWLAEEAIRIEQRVLSETVGCQDQAAAAFGGLNIYRFRKGSPIVAEPLVLSTSRRDCFNDHLMLFFTGFSRTASDVAKSQVTNIPSNVQSLMEIRTLVDDAIGILCSTRDIRGIGELLHHAWELKRGLSSDITNTSIDAIYDSARAAGAIGGKLLGAGAGGFMLLFVEPSYQDTVRDALSTFVHVPFRFENTGSQIVYYQP
jgi:D-glycero-alpha-D-manno-heptose-7-phosphate kinase